MTWYSQHHPKSKSRQNTAALSEITEFTERWFPSPLVKISVPLEGINYPGCLTMVFKNNWVIHSAGLSKLLVVNECYNYFWQLKLHLRLQRWFWMLVWQDQRKRDPCENRFAFLLLLSSLICFHLHYLYWLQSSTSHPRWSPHASSLLTYIFSFSLYDITGEERSHHVISG